MTMSPKLRPALTHLLDAVGEGIRLSELTPDQRKLIKYATTYKYVELSPIKGGDWIASRTGRVP